MGSSAKDFEDFAKDCVRLADQADTPTLRERLLDLARIWKQAAIDEEALMNRHGVGVMTNRNPPSPYAGCRVGSVIELRRDTRAGTSSGSGK
jgi:hypothetical protein